MYIIRDFLGPKVFNWQRANNIRSHFKKAFPHNGTYYGKLVYMRGGHLQLTHEADRFVNAIGIKKSQLKEGDFSEIDHCYFKMNPSSQYDTKVTSAELLDKCDFSLDREFTVTVTYNGHLYRGLKEIALDKVEFEKQFFAYPKKFVMISKDNRLGGTSVYTNPQDGKVSTCAMSGNQTFDMFAVIDEDNRYFEIMSTECVFRTIDTAIQEEIVLTINYKVIEEPTNNAQFLKDIEAYFELYRNKKLRGRVNYGTVVYDGPISNIIKKEYFEIHPDYSDWFIGGKLSVARVENSKPLEFIEMFKNSFDTGYKVKDTEWWEYALAITIVIVAIVVTVLSAGAAAPAAGVTVGAVTTGLAAGAAVLSVGALLLNELGGRSAGLLVKQIMWASEAVGYAAAITGLGTSIQAVIQKGVTMSLASMQKIYSIYNQVMSVGNMMQTPNTTTVEEQHVEKEYNDDAKWFYQIFSLGHIHKTTEKIPEFYANAYDYTKYYSTSSR